MDSIVYSFGLAVIFGALIIFFQDQKKKNRKQESLDIQKIEDIIDKYFLELQEESAKQHEAYVKDINFLQKNLKALEKKIEKLEKYKQIDVSVDDSELKMVSKQINTIKVEDQLDQQVLLTAKEDNKNQSQVDVPHQLVIKLHNQGYSVEEIAKQVNLMCGEVQLMIGIANIEKR
ncbi:hypothetical protein BHU72_03435 [Desulfuribacillus stibiiarsenatis]|uniref:Uncharacterized protein n=1 Tax=Desulfuribacillus stibiiarsenatis TaxID=1390249 RepID=A0A1E5L754_9FIRM|nr:hypothetical protein [Desulfuribacillus stibiiarsenatis]OEH85844.1 hypothetical protein BHU72_03435 [Desulfuribacillus stibiiarsenatis]